jgi:DNA-binding GntR family transcriptional regulator
VSSNTIRKALQNLASEGVVTFSRGRYGGTFVSKMPEPTGTGAAPATFTWVSINPETIRSYRLTAEGKA